MIQNPAFKTALIISNFEIAFPNLAEISSFDLDLVIGYETELQFFAINMLKFIFGIPLNTNMNNDKCFRDTKNYQNLNSKESGSI